MSDLSSNQEGNSFLDGQIAQLMGDYLTRLQRYEEAREEYQEASEGYEKLSSASPDFESAQNSQTVIREKLNKLPKRQKSSEDYYLEKLFAVEKPSPRQVSAKSQVNLGQWLENVFEEGWQTIEQLFLPGEPSFVYAYALREQKSNSEDLETISSLIETIDNSQDEETRWRAVESLWRLDPNNRASGMRRVKDLGMLIQGFPLALMVAILPKPDQSRGVLLRIYPMGNQQYLPPHLELVVLDEAGNRFLEADAREADDYIQLKFSGLPGECFSVCVVMGEARIREDFVL